MSMDLISYALVSQSLNAFMYIFAKARVLFDLNLCARASHGHNPSRLMPVAASMGQSSWMVPQ